MEMCVFAIVWELPGRVSERGKGRRGRQRSFSKEAERQKRLSWALLQSSKSNRKKNVSVTKK